MNWFQRLFSSRKNREEETLSEENIGLKKPDDNFGRKGPAPILRPVHVDRNFSQAQVNRSDGDFATSMAVGFATDNAALGMIVGGDPAGAIIGEMLNNSHHQFPDDPCGHDHDHSSSIFDF